jgi:hypothetical protein
MEAQDATIRGWSTSIEVVAAYCPVKECPWEHTWEHETTLGDVIDVVSTHLREVHS